MEHAGTTLRLHGADVEVFEVDARRLAALFPSRVLSVPAIGNADVYRLISKYRRFEADGTHTDPDVESEVIQSIGDRDKLARVVSAAIQLEDHALLNLCLRATIAIIARRKATEILQNFQI